MKELRTCPIICDAVTFGGGNRHAITDLVANHTEFAISKVGKSMYYRAKNSIIQDNADTHLEEWGKLPSLIDAISQQNEGSTLALQVDDQNNFGRLFVSPGWCLQQSRVLLPIFMVDASFSKTPEYTGVHMLLVGTDGNKRLFLLAFAFVPGETCCNWAWFLQMCHRAGFPIQLLPVFTD